MHRRSIRLHFGNNRVITYHGSNFNDHTITIPMPAFNYSDNPKSFNDRKTKASFAGSFDTAGNVRVVRACWRSRRKIYKRKYYDEDGEVQKDFVDEFYGE